MPISTPKDRRAFLTTVTVIALCSSLFLFQTRSYRPKGQFSTVLGDQTSLSAAEIISFTNLIRQQHGLNPLQPNPALMEAATQKAEYIVLHHDFSHTPNHTNAEYFLDASGYPYHQAGENLARNFSTSELVVKGWLKSQSHREILLFPEYTDTGVGLAFTQTKGPAEVIVVQYLANPQSDSRQTPTASPILKIAQIIDDSILNEHPLIIPISHIVIVTILVTLAIIIKYKRLTQPKPPPKVRYWKK